MIEIAAGFQNGAAEFEYNGLDYVLRGRFETGYGDFNLSFNASQYLEYSYELTYGTGEMADAVGTLGFPEWRSNAYVNWNLNNWSANLALDYIGESQERIGDEQVSTLGTR